MSTVEIVNDGAIEKLTIPVPDGGGIVVMKGRNGSGKTTALDAVESLVDVAAHATIEEFGRGVRAEVNRIIADDGVSRLERQRRATTLSTWVDQEGMWNLRGKFDPVTGLRLAGRLDNAIETLFAEATPSTCPSDPIEKQRHLRALALDRLLSGEGGSSGRGHGRPLRLP